MSIFPLKLKPLIPRDLEVGIKMIKTPGVVVQEVEAIPTKFSIWRVTYWLGNMEGLSEYDQALHEFVTYVEFDVPGRNIPYPDNCFYFIIEHVGDSLRPIAELSWGVATSDPLMVDLTITNIYDGVTHSDSIAFQHHRTTLYITPSVYDGSTITLTASMDGVGFGPPIYFSCQPDRHTQQWVTWALVRYNLATGDSTDVGNTTYDEFQGDEVNNITFNGYSWDANDTFTWTITQTLGPAQAPSVTNDGCNTWYFQRLPSTTSYAGTAFSLQCQKDAVDFGDPIVLTCVV